MYNIIFIIISSITFILGLYYYIKNLKFKKDAITTSGEVIDVIEKEVYSFEEKILYYFPVIQFSDQIGNEYKFSSENGEGNSKRNFIGKKVEVLYNPRNPEKAQLKKGNNFIIVLLFSMSLLFLFFGIIG
ncbi:DUF3592 domain-containing protein [Dokdonia pacifica]|uniref:DUF3592 domain-containing protein n=1 Tax=Dokdonia pacifica TaxID=1627892 RepID=A0A239E6R0_9FLAO|nr:DUF3592 domain-containing protein [Dokdonia pacifica]SNS39622.1 Protein of unknown function [Dokdonia pacifica]